MFLKIFGNDYDVIEVDCAEETNIFSEYVVNVLLAS